MRTIHCPAARASLSLDVGAWLKRLASGPSARAHNHMAAAGPHPDLQRPEAEQPLLHSAHTRCTCVQTTTLALRSRASRNCTPHGHRSCTSVYAPVQRLLRTTGAQLQQSCVRCPGTCTCRCSPSTNLQPPRVRAHQSVLALPLLLSSRPRPANRQVAHVRPLPQRPRAPWIRGAPPQQPSCRNVHSHRLPPAMPLPLERGNAA